MQVSGAFVHLILIYFVLLRLITFPYKYVCVLSVAGRRRVWWRWGPSTLTCTSQVTSSMPAPPGWTTCHWSAPLCWVSSASSMSCTKKSVPWLPKQLCWTPLMLTTNIVRRSVKLQILQNPRGFRICFGCQQKIGSIWNEILCGLGWLNVLCHRKLCCWTLQIQGFWTSRFLTVISECACVFKPKIKWHKHNSIKCLY